MITETCVSANNSQGNEGISPSWKKKMEFILSGLNLMCLNIISVLIWPENENTASCSSER